MLGGMTRNVQGVEVPMAEGSFAHPAAGAAPVRPEPRPRGKPGRLLAEETDPWLCTRLELSDALLLISVIQEQRPLVPTVISRSTVSRQLVGLQGGQRHLADEADLVPGRGPRGVPSPVIHADVHAHLRRRQGLHAALGLRLIPLQVGLLIAAKRESGSI